MRPQGNRSESQLNPDRARKQPTQIDKLNIGKCNPAVFKEAGDRLSTLREKCSSLQRRGQVGDFVLQEHVRARLSLFT